MNENGAPERLVYLHTLCLAGSVCEAECKAGLQGWLTRLRCQPARTGLRLPESPSANTTGPAASVRPAAVYWLAAAPIPAFFCAFWRSVG
jgi:hypothetical protein